MFQGYARGSVGDVTFYRMDGKQISRARNRYPRNPKTNAQLYQRAIMASVMQAYAAGKEIFDHSFEGKPVGMGNMREFLSKNSNALRQALIYDANVQPTEHISAVLNAPKTNTPVPNQYIISAGSLQNNLFTIVDASSQSGNALITTPAAKDSESLAEYAQRVGLNVGDIYTFVGFTVNANKTVFVTPNGIGSGAYQEDGSFFFIRLIVNDAITSQDPAEDALLGTIFDIDTTSNVDNPVMFESKLAGLSIAAASALTFVNAGDRCAVIGCIRSELNSGLRSNETLHWAEWNNVYGIDWQNVLRAWTKQKDDLGDSDLILEGGGAGNLDQLPNLPSGLTTEGNYLAVVGQSGEKLIATYNGQAVLATGGNIGITASQENGAGAGFKNLGTYSGALKTTTVTVAIEGGESYPNNQYQATYKITGDGVTFATAQYLTRNASATGVDVSVPVSQFSVEI